LLRTRPSLSALPGDWRKDPTISGGGILVDHGWHNLYLLRKILGPELKLVSSEMVMTGGVDEVCSSLLRSSQASAFMHLSWKASLRSNHIEVIGDKGVARLQDDKITLQTAHGDETITFTEKMSAGSSHPDWLIAMWSAFSKECAGENKGANLAEAEFCVRTIRSAYESQEMIHV
jgi:predicted dehydrogenase